MATRRQPFRTLRLVNANEQLCRAKNDEFETGWQLLKGMFVTGSSVTCWLSGLKDVEQLDEIDVQLEPAELSTEDEAAWKLDSVSVCKMPPGNRFETFYGHRCALRSHNRIQKQQKKTKKNCVAGRFA